MDFFSTQSRDGSGSGPHAFGEVLKRLRRAAGMTQEMLAERAGYSTVYVSMLERGQRLPLPTTIEALTVALELIPRDRAALHAAARAGVQGPEGSPLSGRLEELSALDRHIAGQGQPVLLLAGEPGIGKTRLLQEAAARATVAGMSVLEGGCMRRGGQEPYAPILDAVQRYIRGQSSDLLQADLEGCNWLVRLLPELAGGPIDSGPDDSLPPDQEHRLMCAALVRFLTNIAGPAGTLLILDDLQWAGPDALDLLVVLSRSAADTAIRIVGAYRDIEVHTRHPLSTTVADLAQAGLASQLELAPLSARDTARLLDQLLEGRTITPELRERTLRRTGGVPFFLASCVQMLRQDTPADSIPWDLTQSIRQRMSFLPGGAEDLLAVAAVVGRQVDPEILEAVTGQSEDSVLDALEAARRFRLLEEDDFLGYRFTHDIIREVAESDVSAARRASLHRRIGETLEKRFEPVPVEAIAYHFARSHDRAKAVLYLEHAGDGARNQHALTTAEGYYRELVDRLDASGVPGDAARAREKLGEVLTLLARYEEALGILDRAARQYAEAHDIEGEGRAVAQIGRVHSRRGTPAEGIARIEPLRRRFEGMVDTETAAAGEPELPRTLAQLNVALAALFLARERYAEQLEAAENAAHLARMLGDDRILAGAEVWRGCALGQLGRREEGRRAQEAAIPLAEATSDLASLSHALNDVAFAHEAAGDFALSKPYKERALAVAERVGDPVGIANSAFRCGQHAFLTGEWPQARRYFEQAELLVREVGPTSISAYPLFGLARLSLLEGDLAVTARLAAEATELAKRSDDRQAIRAAEGLLAELDLLEGRPEGARERLAGLGTDDEGLALYPVHAILAEACLHLDDLPEASAWAERGIERATVRQDRVELVEGMRIRALILARERPDEAIVEIQEALELARGMGYAYGEARCLEVLAQVAAARGEAAEVEPRQEEALAIYRRLGACSTTVRLQQEPARATTAR